MSMTKMHLNLAKKEALNMSDLSIFASKFSLNSKSLKEFDESIRFLSQKNEIVKSAEIVKVIDKLLNVIRPISESIKGEFSKSIAISERSIVYMLQEWHSADWPTYKESILELNSKLNTDRFQLSKTDLQVLNDIADALDAECQKLFRRMREK